MVIVVVRHEAHRDRHEVFHHDSISIGTAADNDLVLHDTYRLDPHHARLFVEDGTFAVEAIAGENIDGRVKSRRVRPPHLLMIEGGKLQLGNQTLVLEYYGDEAEIGMLAAVGRGDDATRLVYADWLEEHDHTARAELLRSQLALLGQPSDSKEFSRLTERMYALEARVPPGWASHVFRPAIDVGDAQVAFRVGPIRGARRLDDYASLQIWVAGERLPHDDVAFVPQLVRAIERALDAERLEEFPAPTLDGVENHRRCMSFGLDGIRKYRWLDWGPTTDELTGLAFRDGDDAILTFQHRDSTDVVVARIPIHDLTDRLRRLLSILRPTERVSTMTVDSS